MKNVQGTVSQKAKNGSRTLSGKAGKNGKVCMLFADEGAEPLPFQKRGAKMPVTAFHFLSRKTKNGMAGIPFSDLWSKPCKPKENRMLKLIKLSERERPQLVEMMDEWTAANEKIVPWAIGKCDYHVFDQYLESLEMKAPYGKYVPDSTFFCLDTARNILVGAVNIRHYLNEQLLFSGGHIGDGIRPSERGKGLGTKMIALALDECRKLGIDDVLMCCDKCNAASARTIEKNGGVLENEVLDDGVPVLRYWIRR